MPLSFESLTRTAESPAVMAAFEAIQPDDHAKYLLTSGSTGHPKVVINTHRMLCANQQMMHQVWRFLEHEKPVVLDWLPWSHTFGGNHNFNLVLRNGGALWIDEGRPAPGLVEKSVKNLLEVKPTLYFNVPRGFDMLLPFLEKDEALAREFFARLRMVFYAGAALAQSSWERLEAVARKVREEPVWFTTSWGSTETSPAITSAHWKLSRAGCIGAPLPGMELKFIPNGEKLEMRVRGVSVFPGYRNAPALTTQAFDEEGYYRIGDAGFLVDDDRPERGVAFNGRVAEDFKLSSGTWVSVGTLRLKVVSALAPLVQDAVVTGHDRGEVGVLLFASPAAASLGAAELAERTRAALLALRSEGGGSSQTPARALWLAEPPNADAGEIIAAMMRDGIKLQSICAILDITVADLWKFKHTLDSGKAGLSGGNATTAGIPEASSSSSVPDPDSPIWEKLLDGSVNIDIRLLGLKFLLTKLREQMRVITDPEVRVLKAYELQRYFARYEQTLGHELAQLSKL